ncbi:MAG TPA: NYN domain-containing protein [Ottowia sp.]|nr:MAG: nuclease [Burkholderiales bacterium 68-10]HMT84584.1 NYN domain-containing protein [Ottowia sp.]HOM20516.1 NYN domain-containing protein [Ottowia sp.]HON30465.1 NYN domain-containing protein [Ottowia sp.]HRB09452.1 NYN domain-containing protein [Ottowia sp.]
MSSENLKPDKLAVLIDADNTTATCAQDLLEEIAKYGIASVKRIYGDWSSPALNGWRSVLLKHALVPIQQFAYTKGKDATDMGLIIDAMDLLYSGHFDGFCLVSSDSDFTPLASRIRASGRVVYGFGREKTPEAFRQACDRFFYIENLGEAEKPKNDTDAASATALTINQPGTAKPAAKPRQMDAATRSLLYKSIKDATDEATGWAFVGKIGNVISETRPDFDSRSYGYAKLSGMLRDLRGLQFRTDEANRMYCRKVPFGDLIKLLDEAFSKFKSSKGWANLDVVGKYVKPRWDWEEYGFDSFPDLLGKVDHVEIANDSMRMQAPIPS